MLAELGKNARKAARQLALASAVQKNDALARIADQLWQEREVILSANQKDVTAGVAAGLSPALLDRLTITENGLHANTNSLRDIAALNDPVGEIFDEQVLANGLKVHKRRVPIGVIAVIYEARPDVTIEVSGLTLTTGNAVILRGGKETIHSNRALVGAIRKGLEKSDLPLDAIQFIDNPDRALVLELLKMHQDIDMLIPRGAAALHQFCRQNSTIPVITGGIGICHLFVDESANLESALSVIQNAKVQRPTVCNALDTVLVHRAVAGDFIPRLVACLSEDRVTFRADERSYKILGGVCPERVQPAQSGDFDTEWLSLVLGIRVVDNIVEALEHIARHSTSHSDGILTQDAQNAERFLREVDSAVVYLNASTRFTDGGQLGMGAEVAVSTQRLHARGPMGLQSLTTYKWVVIGEGHIRQ